MRTSPEWVNCGPEVANPPATPAVRRVYRCGSVGKGDGGCVVDVVLVVVVLLDVVLLGGAVVVVVDGEDDPLGGSVGDGDPPEVPDAGPGPGGGGAPGAGAGAAVPPAGGV